jgi:hypothetical protein
MPFLGYNCLFCAEKVSNLLAARQIICFFEWAG